MRFRRSNIIMVSYGKGLRSMSATLQGLHSCIRECTDHLNKHFKRRRAIGVESIEGELPSQSTCVIPRHQVRMSGLSPLHLSIVRVRSNPQMPSPSRCVRPWHHLMATVWSDRQVPSASTIARR